MKYTCKKRSSKAFIHVKNNIVIKVSNEFANITGYSIEEQLGKTISMISNMLIIDSQINLCNIKSQHSCFIFTKEFEPREVTIICKSILIESEQIYFIEEKYNSRIEDSLPYTSSVLPYNELNVAICSFPDGILLKANDEFYKFFNIAHKEIRNYIGRNIMKLFPEYNINSFESNFIDVINNIKSYHAKEVKYKLSQKDYSYCDESLVPIYIKGKAKYLVYNSIVVTERVESRKIIEKQNKELEAIIENISDELLIFSSDGDYIKMNKLARENALFNLETAKNIKDAYKEVEIFDFHGNVISFENIPLNRVIRGESISNFREIRKNSSQTQYVEISGTPIYDCEGNFNMGILVVRDIKESLKEQENIFIKSQYDSLRKVLENFEVGFVRCSYPDFKIIDINNKGYDFTKKLVPSIHSYSVVKGQYLAEYIKYRFEKISEVIDNSIKNKENSCFAIFEDIIDGEEIFVKYIFQPTLGFSNEVVEITIIGIDITEEVKAKNEIEMSLKIQDEIYANVAHELKTPLNVIYSANQMMEIYLGKNSMCDNIDKLYWYNNSIKQNCFRLIKLINNIVDLSKINSGVLKLNPTNVNIVKLIENIVYSVCDYVKSKELNIIFNTDIEEKIIACDYEKIERIMLNLISNAIKFSNVGDNIYVDFSVNGEYSEISIKDTGVGIEKANINYIFKRFYQEDKSLSRNTEGSGIGLSLVKSLVDMHDGEISVESEVGKGSTFIVKLPSIILEKTDDINEINFMNNKVNLLNIEFSDIYNL